MSDNKQEAIHKPQAQFCECFECSNNRLQRDFDSVLRPESVSAPAPDSRQQALNSLSRSEMEEGIYERVPAQEVTRPIEEQLWSLAMSVYHAGGNNHDFCEQATALLAYKPPAEEVAECDCDSCKAGDKEVLDYASLSAQLEQAKQERDEWIADRDSWFERRNVEYARAEALESTNIVLHSALEKVVDSSCMCRSSKEKNWHHETCWKGIALAALAALQGETKNGNV